MSTEVHSDRNEDYCLEKYTLLAALDERTWKLRIHRGLADKYETELSKSY
ncbi:MAG: hypothetical protein SCJ94_07865 [Bacillota bacterium]|nr:hypothetical protein [Bacillota bacterium]